MGLFRFCLVVPAGSWRLDPLVTALRASHPNCVIGAVWAGDPHLRPSLEPALDVTWLPSVTDPTGIGWGRLLVALAPRVYEWSVAARSIELMLAADPTPVIALWVGSVAVLGDVTGLVSSASITVLPRVLQRALPADGQSPTEADLAADGKYSTVVACFGQDSRPALRWLGEQLALAEEIPAGRWLERMAELFAAAECTDESMVVGAWRGDPPEVALIDLDYLDRAEPWHFTFSGGPSRARLSQLPVLAAAVAVGVAQVDGEGHQLRLPGGIAIDPPMRTLMRRAIHDWTVAGRALPPEPFSARNSDFIQWLEMQPQGGANLGRYWLELHRYRADLQAAFPHVQSFDTEAYRFWTTASWRLEARSVLLGQPVAVSSAIASVGEEADGINVLGYLDFDQSQGHIARGIIAALRDAQVPVRALNHPRSLGSPREQKIDEPREAKFSTNIVVVNADQFEFVVSDYGPTLLDGRHTIGYWFWELEHVPAAMVKATQYVQEIWTGSQFIADAFSAVTTTPVRCVSLPVAEPLPSGRDRASFGLADDRFVFLATFDQFSVPERKNPFGVIAAFRHAFSANEGPLLWIKTMNGDKGWRQHERLLLAAAGRSDIIIWDEHLTRGDQMAVLNSADCLVSLHRSEGLGLHCAEAMWLAKPVIATRYSGNLDFMDDTCSALIDYHLVPVQHGEGIYPPAALWAEPSTEQAADWMRRLVYEPNLATRLGDAARQRMMQQPSRAEVGQTLARLAGLPRTMPLASLRPLPSAGPNSLSNSLSSSPSSSLSNSLPNTEV